MAKPTSFLPPFFPPPEISSFWGTSIAITPFETQEAPPTSVGRKYSIGPSLLTSSSSMTLTHLLFSITSLAVTPLLTFPLLPPLSPFLAHGRCYRTWVLISYQFFYLSLFHPTNVPLPSIFRQPAGITLPSYFDFHCPSAEKYSPLSLSSAATVFTSLALNATKSSIPFSRIKHHSKAWWFAEVEEAVSERSKVFAVAHKSDKIARLTSLLLDMLRLSSQKQRLRHGRQLALPSRPNQTVNLYTLFSTLLLALLHPLLTSPTVPLPGNRLWSLPIT